MPSMLRLSGVALFALLGLFYVAFGALYASVDDLLWFHAAAVPMESLEAVRPLYFALMKLIGGAAASLGALGIVLAVGPVRTGSHGLAIALFIAFALPLGVAAHVAETLAAATGAPTSWHVMGALAAADALALSAVLAARRA